MAKKKKKEEINELPQFYLKDVDEYVKNNKILELYDLQEELSSYCVVKTMKGILYFRGLDVAGFKKSYCSCTNILKAHYTTVANALSSAMTKAHKVYVKYDNDNSNL